MVSYEKRGYLNSDFRLFHLTDTGTPDIDYHVHDFNKVIIFFRGNVDYIVEGRTYSLEPYDILLVGHNELHRPVIDPSVPYERIVVYLSPAFITTYQTQDYDLSRCFIEAASRKTNVLRLHSSRQSSLLTSIQVLEQACSEKGYASELRRQLLFLEFMIQLNRAALSSQLGYLSMTGGSPKIQELIAYINAHLTEDLSMDALSRHCFLSKYHMMRLFKSETGCTIHTYILNKRLLLARDRLHASPEGCSITQICYECGFQNYSNFSRAYRQLFGQSPRQHKNPTG